MLILNSSGLRVGLQRAQPRHVLGRLPVHHLAVVERRLHQHRRVGLRREVVVRAVALACTRTRSCIFGLPHSSNSPTVSGSVVVEHRVDHVDERHLRDHRAEQVGPHVGDRAHEQPAGAAALDRPGGRGAVYFCAIRCSATAMKSVKVFFFVQHAALVVPALAELAAAADVGDARRRRRGRAGSGGSTRTSTWHRDAVGAVGRQAAAGCVPSRDSVLPVDERDRDLGAVRRRRVARARTRSCAGS